MKDLINTLLDQAFGDSDTVVITEDQAANTGDERTIEELLDDTFGK